VHTGDERTLQARIFLYDPDIISELANLIHPDREVPMPIQAASFYALDAIVRLRTKQSDVLSAVHASVNHGNLMYVVRKTVADLEKDERKHFFFTGADG
jgi:E3 ubiquitin-protein ligase HUWE1